MVKGVEIPRPHEPVELSPRLEVAVLPCLENEFVTLKPTVRHPGLDRPLTYLGGFELAPLLRLVRSGMTPLQIASAWSARVPPPAGFRMTGWLLAKGLLVPSSRTCATDGSTGPGGALGGGRHPARSFGGQPPRRHGLSPAHPHWGPCWLFESL
jgi:hypothetical protein